MNQITIRRIEGKGLKVRMIQLFFFTGENDYKLEHRKFQSAKELLDGKGYRALEQLPRVVVDSPSLEMFKTHLDAYLYSLL